MTANNITKKPYEKGPVKITIIAILLLLSLVLVIVTEVSKKPYMLLMVLQFYLFFFIDNRNTSAPLKTEVELHTNFLKD